MGEWTPGQLTDSELTERRADLERKIAVCSADSPRLRLLQGKLDAILTEIRVRPMRRQLPLDQQLSPIAEALASSRAAAIDL
jgi:hypothetical protein